jgi:hypothetical protein
MRWTNLHDERLEAISCVLFSAFVLFCVLLGV